MAAFMLIVWPVVTLAIFARLGPARGLIWSTLAGYLLLPSGYGFSLPGLPDYSKRTAISFSLLLAAIIFRHRLPPRPPRVTSSLIRNVLIACVVLLVIGAVFTFLDNRNPISAGERVRPGLGIKDVIAMIHQPFFAFVPFILGMIWLDRTELHRELVLAMTLGGLFYGLLVLFEWRMSPQLNSWIYGYFAHGWRQHLREGGFRAIVFLEHGLSVGFFLFSTFLAALGAALASREGQMRTLFLVATGFIFFCLVLSYNFGALMIAVLFGAALFFMGRHLALWTAVAATLLFLFLPAVRQAGVVTFDSVIAFADGINPNRANSFSFRLEQEDAMLAHAAEKPLFGWGGWARARGVGIDEDGRVVTDGFWIIQLGETGWVGYLAYFGLLALPLLALPFVATRRDLSFITVAMALICAGNFIYLIPNSTLSPVGYLTFGALAGYVLQRYVPTASAAEEQGVTRRGRGRPVGYTRFPEGSSTRTSRQDAAPDKSAARRKLSRPRPGRPAYSRRPE